MADTLSPGLPIDEALFPSEEEIAYTMEMCNSPRVDAIARLIVMAMTPPGKGAKWHHNAIATAIRTESRAAEARAEEAERRVDELTAATTPGEGRQLRDLGAELAAKATSRASRLEEALRQEKDALEQARLYIERDEAAHGRQFGDGNAVRRGIARIDASLAEKDA